VVARALDFLNQVVFLARIRRTLHTVVDNVQYFYFVGFVEVENAEFDVLLVGVEQGQLFARGDLLVVDEILDPALGVVNDRLDLAALVDHLVEFGVHFLVVALVGVEPQDLGVDLVQGGVLVVAVEESEHQTRLVALDRHNLELEFPGALGHQRVLGLERIPVVCARGFDEHAVLEFSGADEVPVGEVDYLRDAAAQLDRVDQLFEVLLEALEILGD